MVDTRKTSCNGGKRVVGGKRMTGGKRATDPNCVSGGKRASKKSYRKTQKRVRFLKQRKHKVKGG